MLVYPGVPLPLMPGARTAGTTDAVAWTSWMEIDGKALPMRREEVIRLVIRPKAESKSGYEKIAFFHKSASQRSRT